MSIILVQRAIPQVPTECVQVPTAAVPRPRSAGISTAGPVSECGIYRVQHERFWAAGTGKAPAPRGGGRSCCQSAQRRPPAVSREQSAGSGRRLRTRRTMCSHACALMPSSAAQESSGRPLGPPSSTSSRPAPLAHCHLGSPPHPRPSGLLAARHHKMSRSPRAPPAASPPPPRAVCPDDTMTPARSMASGSLARRRKTRRAPHRRPSRTSCW